MSRRCNSAPFAPRLGQRHRDVNGSPSPDDHVGFHEADDVVPLVGVQVESPVGHAGGEQGRLGDQQGDLPEAPTGPVTRTVCDADPTVAGVVTPTRLIPGRAGTPLRRMLCEKFGLPGVRNRLSLQTVPSSKSHRHLRSGQFQPRDVPHVLGPDGATPRMLVGSTSIEKLKVSPGSKPLKLISRAS